MSYNRNGYNSQGCQGAQVLLILMAFIFICFPFGLLLLVWDHVFEIEPQKQHQEAALVCEDGESCVRRGFHYYENKEYDKTARDWEKACNEFRHAIACTNRGVMEFNGELPQTSPERALDFAARGCELDNLNGCQLKANVLGRHFSDRPGAREEIRELYIKACSPELPRSCGKAAALFYVAEDYEKSYEFAARGCPGDGSDKTATACIYRALAAEKAGKSDPPREERIKTIKDGCDKHEIPYVCAVYAQEITEDDRERLTYMDKACHLHDSPEFCDTARQARREVTNIEARLPELQKACSEDDRVACLRIGKFYETNNALSPRERLARATEVYETLCQKRDRQGCAELRRLKKSAGR
ncbi:MAG: sel1 repeat family protein [Succinimonas sp.]|nr:sel1 repeat family protein [Succinimonas sp.]